MTTQQKTKRVLILGGNGMLGHKLAQHFSRESSFETHCSVRRLPQSGFKFSGVNYHSGIDVSSQNSSLRELLEQLRPDITINAIGAIKQKDLDADMDGTLYVNGTLPHMLPLLNPNKNGKVIHISTDCVFKGDQGNYRETTKADAEDLYGRSKACGEIDYGRHLTLRTSIIGFEFSGFLGLVSWLFRSPKHSELQGYHRAIYSGLPTVTLTKTIIHVLKNYPELSGLYHVASEPINKLDLLQQINDRFQLGFRFTPSERVVMDRSLNDDLLRGKIGTPRPKWKDLIEKLFVDYHSLPYGEAGATQ